jgi:LysM repeat protein
MLRIPIVAILVAATVTMVGATSATASSPTSGCGIDYAWYRPSDYQLNVSGCATIARYIQPAWESNGKDITPTERANLHALGKSVVLVYERWATRALDGYWAGVTDGNNALAGARRVGLPDDIEVTLYAAVDWDITDAQKPAVAEYLRGYANTVGWGRSGVYGGYWAVKYMADRGVVKRFWQTYAWSGGLWDYRSAFRQTSNGFFWGGGGDLNTVIGDTGAWYPGQTSAPVTPPPVVTPRPPAAPVSGRYAVQPGDTLSSIAGAFGTSWQALWALNRATVGNPNLIYPGQILITSAPPGRNVTVRSGDTLSGLAATCGCGWSALWRANRDHVANPNLIYPGQVLNCP